MPSYRVHFTTTMSGVMTVEADDYIEAIETAAQEMPNDVCAQCSGWGQDWSMEIDGEWDEYEVTDAETDESVWSKPEEGKS